MDEPTTTVLGATGGQGGAVLRALRAGRHPVRAVVRETTSPSAQRLAGEGVEVAAADLFDADGLTRVFTNASAAFAVTTPFESGAQAEVAQGEAIATAAERAGLPYLVLASVASADRHTGVPHFDSKAAVERRLADTSVRHAVVAPTFFYDNVLGDPAIGEGRLPLALPGDLPLQQTARDDVGALVAHLLTRQDPPVGMRIEVAGDDPTPRRMAAVITAASGHPVHHDHVPVEAVRADSADLGAMFAFLAETGYQVDVPALRRAFPEVPWTGFASWAWRQAWP
ncbi:NmrA/HSCARG family protein [Salinifilum aidingensis]